VQDAPAEQVTPVLVAQLLRLRGTAAAARALHDDNARLDGTAAEADLRAGIAQLGELGAVPYVGCAQAALGTLLTAQGRHGEAASVIDSARHTFQALAARHWLRRLDAPGGWLAGR
jgi:hypothetical protein